MAGLLRTDVAPPRVPEADRADKAQARRASSCAAGRLVHAGVVAAHRLQIGIQVAAGSFVEYFAGLGEFIDAVGAEVAEVLAQPAPGAERPLAAPERQAQRLDLARAEAAAFVAIRQPQHLAADDGRVQPVDQGGEILAVLVAPDRRKDPRAR